MLKRLILAGMALLIAGSGALASAAEQWPTQPIRLIVPFSAGGPTDALAREVAKQLQAELGQNVIVENVLGAAGQIALEKVTRAPADGYTIVISANTIQAVAPHLSKLPYDTIKGFTPLGGLAGFPYGLTVAPNSPITSVQDLVARAKAAPGTVSSGSAGMGTGTDLTINMLAQVANVSFNEVNYKGSAPVMTDLMGGHIDFSFEVISNAVPLYKQGLVKVLATTGKTRHKVISNVPAMNEIYPGFEFVAWFALYGPPDMPPAVVKRYSDALLKIQTIPEFQTFINERGFDATPASAEELDRMTRDELAKWGNVIAKMPNNHR